MFYTNEEIVTLLFCLLIVGFLFGLFAGWLVWRFPYRQITKQHPVSKEKK